MPHMIHDSDWGDFRRLMSAWKSGRLVKTNPTGENLPDGRPLIRAILLEDLESGGNAEAAVTRRQFVDEIQMVDLEGTVSDGTFKLKFGESTTADIAWNADADELREALEALPSINPGDVIVAAYPLRWSVQFTGQFSGTDAANLSVAENALSGIYNRVVISTAWDWVDANRTETIHGQIPVGLPTPLKAGVVLSAGWFPEAASYCVLNVECRDLDYDQPEPSYGS